MNVTVWHVNAFTANQNGGNPAGVVIDADDYTEAQMLAIAKEVGFSETAFIGRSDKATKKLRFFTPVEEVNLCGHATIASWVFMYKSGIVGEGDYTQETKAGVLKISVNKSLVYMEQAKAEFYDFVGKEELATILGLNISGFNPALEPQIVSTGLKDLIVPLADETALAAITPDFSAISKLSQKYDITGLHVICLLDNQESIFSSRNFAPLYGINEEAATGTSNGAALCYLKKHNALPEKTEYRIEQGLAMNKLSYIYGQFKDEVVWIGGEATTVKEFTLEV